MSKLKYVDTKPIWFPRLSYHPHGLRLPSGDNTLEVTDGEEKELLKRKNGDNPCFEKVSARKTEPIKEMEEN